MSICFQTVVLVILLRWPQIIQRDGKPDEQGQPLDKEAKAAQCPGSKGKRWNR